MKNLHWIAAASEAAMAAVVTFVAFALQFAAA